MDAAGYTFTMAMFGEVAFSVMKREGAIEAAKLLEVSFPGYEAVIVGIDGAGSRVTSRSR